MVVWIGNDAWDIINEYKHSIEKYEAKKNLYMESMRLYISILKRENNCMSDYDSESRGALSVYRTSRYTDFFNTTTKFIKLLRKYSIIPLEQDLHEEDVKLIVDLII